jgi:serine/threonine protein phosphatase 1
MLDVIGDPARLQVWRQFGGLQTLRSYGLNPSLNPTANEQTDLVERLVHVMPDSHFQFLRTLRPAFSCGDFFFVHAGVRPGVPLRDQDERDLLWIRDEFLETDEDFGQYIVHGHTPVSVPDVRPNRINIDTGAYATGNLTLLTIQGSSMLAI